MKTAILVALIVVGIALGVLLGAEIGMRAREPAHPLATTRPDIVNVELITKDEARELHAEQKPTRHLRVFSLFDSWWWRTDPAEAMSSMGKMKGDGEIGGMSQIVKKRMTVPVIMGFAGVLAVLAGALIAWKGGSLKGGLIIGAVGVGLLVAAVAFEAQPLIAVILLIVGGIAALAYVATSTAVGRKVLESLGIVKRQRKEIVAGGQGFKTAVGKEEWVTEPDKNKRIVERILAMFKGEQLAKQDHDTQAVVLEDKGKV